MRIVIAMILSTAANAFEVHNQVDNQRTSDVHVLDTFGTSGGGSLPYCDVHTACVASKCNKWNKLRANSEVCGMRYFISAEVYRPDWSTADDVRPCEWSCNAVGEWSCPPGEMKQGENESYTRYAKDMATLLLPDEVLENFDKGSYKGNGCGADSDCDWGGLLEGSCARCLSYLRGLSLGASMQCDNQYSCMPHRFDDSVSCAGAWGGVDNKLVPWSCYDYHGVREANRDYLSDIHDCVNRSQPQCYVDYQSDSWQKFTLVVLSRSGSAYGSGGAFELITGEVKYTKAGDGACPPVPENASIAFGFKTILALALGVYCAQLESMR